MRAEKMSTGYADAERLAIPEIRKTCRAIGELPYVQHILDSLPNPAMVLNRCRQIVFVNRALVGLVDVPAADPVLGKRPGEVFHCVFSSHEKAGCGTSRYCSACGALAAFLESREINGPAEKEARILTRSANGIASYDMQVSVSPFPVDGEMMYVAHLVDISHEKRRNILERIFFHDILNTAGNIYNMSRMMHDESTRDLENWGDLIQMASGLLIGEIESQRSLLAAERDELQIVSRETDVKTVAEQVVQLFERQAGSRGIRLSRRIPSGDYRLVTDRSLLQRVITNLIKNAIEASVSGDEVAVACGKTDNGLIVRVTNPAVIPPDQQLQIFQRSFSTKGTGRGIGTYSIKLLTEKYLKGQVTFTSTPEAGTCFEVRLPFRI